MCKQGLTASVCRQCVSSVHSGMRLHPGGLRAMMHVWRFACDVVPSAHRHIPSSWLHTSTSSEHDIHTDRASASSPLAPAVRGPGDLGRRSACMLRGRRPPRRWAGVLRCTSPQKNIRQLCVFWRQRLFLALVSNPLQGLVLLAVRSYEGLLADRVLRCLSSAVVIPCLKVADQCFTRRAARIDNA